MLNCVVGALAILCISCCLAGCGSVPEPPTPAPAPPAPEPINNENCFLIDATPPAKGTEDVVTFSDDILITGEVDLDTMWGNDTHDGNPLGAKPGGLLFIDASDPSQPTLARMSRIDFPGGVHFNPHGQYFLPEGSLLHVINHAYTMGGERIDVFKITAIGRTPEAQWLYAWKNDFFTQRATGVLNDLAVVDADHLFVTRYMPGEAEEGRKAGAGARFMDDVAANLSNGTTEFYYCTRNPAEDTSDCVVADTNFAMANGINFGNDEKSLLYVNDVFRRELRTYSVDLQADTPLSSLGTLSLGEGYADNIEWNRFQTRLFLSNIVIGGTKLVGALELIPDPENPVSNAGLTTLVLDNSGKLGGVTSANFANGNIYMGSGNIVLVCPTKLATAEWVV